MWMGCHIRILYWTSSDLNCPLLTSIGSLSQFGPYEIQNVHKEKSESEPT